MTEESAPTTASASAADLERALKRVAGESTGTYGFYVHDLHSDVRASVRADEAFPAASVIKLPILLRALELVHVGAVPWEQPLRLSAWHKTGGSGIFQHFHNGMAVTLEDACTAMIALSDNTTTNMVLDVTGIASVNEMLNRRGCPRTRLHRYLGKPEMAGPAGPSQAVPREIGQLLELLLGRQILSPALCEEAMVLLRRQTHRALIPRLLPEGTPVAHKTGSLNGVRHDAGIVWRPGEPKGDNSATARDVMAIERKGFAAGHPIILVAMSRDVADQRWTVENEAEQTIARAARIVYDHFTRPYSSSASSASSPPVTVSRT
jgi:beta-lactamase class A